MDHTELQALLDLKYDQFNKPGFIEDDPVSIPHMFRKKEDIEISAFLSAVIAWGRRVMIIKNANRLVEMMDMAPHDFILNASEHDMEPLTSFVHRTFNGEDCLALIQALRRVYQDFGGLENIFSSAIKPSDDTVYEGIEHARSVLLATEGFPARTYKHVASPARGSAAKRINMFLRWMVRNDGRGVDFGIWKNIASSQLICPLDVHTGNVARKLGLLERKQNDWKAALELTTNLRKFSAEDPVKYDFSLFGLGVFEAF
ncbi:MAG: TIGR02757 family protein [Bacteroidota bacterium]